MMSLPDWSIFENSTSSLPAIVFTAFFVFGVLIYSPNVMPRLNMATPNYAVSCLTGVS